MTDALWLARCCCCGCCWCPLGLLLLLAAVPEDAPQPPLWLLLPLLPQSELASLSANDESPLSLPLTALAGVGGPRGDVPASPAVAPSTLEGPAAAVDSVDGTAGEVDAEDAAATEVSPFLSTDKRKNMRRRNETRADGATHPTGYSAGRSDGEETADGDCEVEAIECGWWRWLAMFCMEPSCGDGLTPSLHSPDKGPPPGTGPAEGGDRT